MYIKYRFIIILSIFINIFNFKNINSSQVFQNYKQKFDQSYFNKITPKTIFQIEGIASLFILGINNIFLKNKFSNKKLDYFL